MAAPNIVVGPVLGASYGFEHQDYTRKRNYGIVTVRLSAGEAPRVQGSLERAV